MADHNGTFFMLSEKITLLRYRCMLKEVKDLKAGIAYLDRMKRMALKKLQRRLIKLDGMKEKVKNARTREAYRRKKATEKLAPSPEKLVPRPEKLVPRPEPLRS